MEKELPKNWAETKLKEVVSYKKGKKPKKLSETEFQDSVPYLDIKAFEKNEIRRYADIPSSNIIQENQIGIVWDGARSGWVTKGKYGAVGSTIAILNPIGINENYLLRFLESKFDFINTNTRGTGIPHVDPKLLWRLNFPLPPRREQDRIVVKLDKLFQQLEEINKSLEKIPVLLKNFRQQVLTEAVMGKLTEEWRDENSKWEKSTIKEVSFKIFDGPFGSNLKTADYTNDGVQVVRLENIKRLYFDNSKQSFISLEKYKDLMNNTLRKGDIIFASFVGDEIRAALLPDLPHTAINKADCFCIRIDEKKINKKYCLYFLLSDKGKNQINELAHGMTRPRINLTQLRSIRISLPSLEEQDIIVNQAEGYFEKADKIQAKYELLKAKIEQLPHAILQKTFKGELVPQLESDGHARDLLEEIKNSTDNLVTRASARKKAMKNFNKNFSKEFLTEQENISTATESGSSYSNKNK